MKVPFVDLKAQHRALEGEIEAAVAAVMRSAEFILGNELALFEQEFADYCHVRHAVGVDSGLSALELGLRACGVGPGDEVITVANTFIATASAIASVGARPVLVDADPQSYNIDVNALECAVTPRTSAIIPVHLFGQTADMDPILTVASKHGLRVIEDACQAHGATYRGRPVGAMGDCAAFSFYPSKNLGAYGDGGMLVTNDPTIADSVQMLRNYGQREKYRHESLAFNRRLDTLQAAILRVKLRRLDGWNEARRSHARLYSQLLAGTPVETPVETPGWGHVYHLYVIRTARRDALQAHLGQRGIASGIHYPIPMHLQRACRTLGYARGDFLVAEQHADEMLSLPMYPELTPAQVAYVAEAITEFHTAAPSEGCALGVVAASTTGGVPG